MFGEMSGPEILVMAFGGVLALVGLYQVFRKGGEAVPADKAAASSIKLFKFEFVLPRASLFVFLVGCGLFATPLFFGGHKGGSGGGSGSGSGAPGSSSMMDLVRTLRDSNQNEAARRAAFAELMNSGMGAQTVSNDLVQTMQSGDQESALAAYVLLSALARQSGLQQQQQAAVQQWMQMNALLLQQQEWAQQQQPELINPSVLFGSGN